MMRRNGFESGHRAPFLAAARVRHFSPGARYEHCNRFATGKEEFKMRPRVLIVDDDAAITQQLFWTLSDEYEVMTANDLASAVRRATIYEPVVSILDLHLPPVPDTPEVGMRILGYLKDRLPHSKVLVISSAADEQMRVACFANGADEFLDKPFEIDQLLAVVRRIAPEQVYT
jgi:DNA-binding response OmpR family regulator